MSSVHPTRKTMNMSKQDGCYAPLIGDFLITRNLVSVHECDVTFEWYCKSLETVFLFCGNFLKCVLVKACLHGLSLPNQYCLLSSRLVFQ